MTIEQIGVVGAGQMGSGIAQVCAAAGRTVVMCDRDSDAVERGVSAIRKSLERLQGKGKLSAEEVAAILERIKTSTSLEALSDVDIVIEAVSEVESLKNAIFTDLDRICKPQAILASNTSSLSLTRLAAASGRPERVIGMHFFNPVPVLPLVEVIRALQTSDEVFKAVTGLAEAIGKVPVDVKDAPGFVGNRILLPMINEAIFCLHEQLASAEEIDKVMKLGMGHPMGPLALADLIGLDTCLSIMEVLYEGYNDSKYRPCPLLKQMVAAGYLGRKSGRGFYDYQ